jgi:hypothetical protein
VAWLQTTGIDDDTEESDEEDDMAAGSIGPDTKGNEMGSSVAQLVTQFKSFSTGSARKKVAYVVAAVNDSNTEGSFVVIVNHASPNDYVIRGIKFESP